MINSAPINRLLRGHGCDRCRPGPPVQVERPQRGEDGLDGGENVGGQLDLPAGSCEVGAMAITEGDRTPRAAARSFCAYCSGCNTRRASPGVTALYLIARPRDGEREDRLGEQCLTLPGVRVEVSSNDRRWRAAVEGTRPGHSCHRTLCEDRSTVRLLTTRKRLDILRLRRGRAERVSRQSAVRKKIFLPAALRLSAARRHHHDCSHRTAISRRSALV